MDQLRQTIIDLDFDQLRDHINRRYEIEISERALAALLDAAGEPSRGCIDCWLKSRLNEAGLLMPAGEPESHGRITVTLHMFPLGFQLTANHSVSAGEAQVARSKIQRAVESGQAQPVNGTASRVAPKPS